MKRVCLLGSPGTKRTLYLQRAAAEAGVPLALADWGKVGAGWPWQKTDAALFVKADPPVWESCRLEELGTLTLTYRRRLMAMAASAGSGHVTFLNAPGAIAALLDKRVCKQTLTAAGLPVTEMLDGRIDDTETLLAAMEETGWRQVFVKPCYGSGAAGVSALRLHPRTGRMALYTCAAADPMLGIVNTKRLRRYDRSEEVLLLLERILRLDCIVERWYPKAVFQGLGYDLRAVMQDGHMDFLLARMSGGPITNLHLNNRPLDAARLGLDEAAQESLARLCRKAMACFPGLRSAGIDLLLEKGSLRPRIIEMNGQGDLIYEDIFHENRIYRHQAAMMKQWAETEGSEQDE